LITSPSSLIVDKLWKSAINSQVETLRLLKILKNYCFVILLLVALDSIVFRIGLLTSYASFFIISRYDVILFGSLAILRTNVPI
jgi:hypothetical protein